MNNPSSYHRGRQHRSRTSKGFTLIELLVSLGLFTIIVTIAVAGFTSALRTQRQVSSLISAQSNVSLVLEQMAREIRTGYLFCHDDGSNAPSASCNDPAGNPCVIGDSGYADPGAPDALPDGDLPTWTCGALDYYNAQGAHVNYSLINGALAKTDSSAASQLPQSITGDDVSVKYVHFILFGNVEGDNWTPRVTIAIGVAPSSSDAAVSSDVMNFQTTVSARNIDCDTTGSSTAC